MLQNVPTLPRFDKDVESPEMKIIIQVVYVYVCVVRIIYSAPR